GVFARLLGLLAELVGISFRFFRLLLQVGLVRVAVRRFIGLLFGFFCHVVLLARLLFGRFRLFLLLVGCLFPLTLLVFVLEAALQFFGLLPGIGQAGLDLRQLFGG